MWQYQTKGTDPLRRGFEQPIAWFRDGGAKEGGPDFVEFGLFAQEGSLKLQKLAQIRGQLKFQKALKFLKWLKFP